MKPSPGDNVAVIGAGAAGLTAALRLVERGYRVMLFEASPKVGGKCASVEVDGAFVDLGAVLCPPLRYPATHDLMQEIGIEAGRLPLPLPKWVVHPETRRPVRRRSGLAPFGESIRYCKELLRFRRCGRNGAAFATPFGEWCSDRGLTRLGAQLTATFRKLGYGDLAITPAWYALMFFDLRLGVASLFPGRHSAHVSGGFGDFWFAVSAKAMKLGVDLYLETAVTRAARNQDGVKLVTARGEYTADHLVLAIPPAQIGKAVSDLDYQERNLLDGIRTAPIISVVAEVAGAGIEDQIGGQLIPTDRAVTMVGLWPWSRPGHAGTVWYVSPQGAGVELGGEPPEGWMSWISSRHLLPEGWHPTRVIKAHHWPEYFPHFTPEAMAAGALETLTALQGSRCTYFLGGWTTFELVEDTILQAESVVRRHFPPG